MPRTQSAFILLFLTFNYCSDREDKIEESENLFTFSNEKFSIARAGIADFGIDPTAILYTGNFLVLLFVTEGITFSTEANGNLLLTGTGAILGLVTFSNSNDYLDDGNYFVNLRPPFEKGDVSIGFYTTTFDSKEVNGPYFDYEGIPILSGKMTVNNLEENIQITLNMIDEIGNKINFNYEGMLDLLTYNIPPKILQ